MEIKDRVNSAKKKTQKIPRPCFTARNLYQLNANEVPLTLHYGFEGRIIISHKNSYRWKLQNEAETVGNIVIYYLKMTLMLIEKVLKNAFKLRAGTIYFVMNWYLQSPNDVACIMALISGTFSFPLKFYLNLANSSNSILSLKCPRSKEVFSLK